MATPGVISFKCPYCEKQLKAPSGASGRKAKCKGCGSKIEVPRVSRQKTDDHTMRTVSRPANPPPESRPVRSPDNLVSAPDLSAAIAEAEQIAQRQSAAKEAAKLTLPELEAAFLAKLPKKSVSFAYRFHLMLVAAAMAALPVLYVVLVAAAGLGVYYYTVFVLPGLFKHTPVGRATFFYVAMIVTPAIAGVVVVLFLVKPLFFRIKSDGRTRSLTRKGEPLLFEWVDRICDSTGAPRPARINVDYQVNASAQPLGGLFSVATGRMILTIGVPLITGLSAQQLTGVLAHEFGHFSQKVGMGASLIIRRVNWWFTRVVYQRDAMDEALEESINDSDSWFSLVFVFAQLCVYFSRGVLWCFMMAGNAISSGLLRQMEFDADRYEYGLVGSKCFQETVRELRVLGAVQPDALGLMFQMFTKGQLADDMMLISERLRAKVPQDALRSIEDSVAKESGSLLATHPSDRARVDRAHAAAMEAKFKLERPARCLVKHYKQLCKNVTWDFYRDQLGSRISPKQLTPTERLINSEESPV